MRPISDRFRAALGVSHKRSTRITCTIPGADPVRIDQAEELSPGVWGPGWTAGSVSSSASTGVRYQASLTITPEPGADTYGLVSTPGAIFAIDHGIDFGAGDIEYVECGRYEATKAAVKLGDGDIGIPLADLWVRVERDKFIDPYYPDSGTRSSRIVEAVQGAIASVSAVVLADGGLYEQGDNLWDRDRPKFINDMATDGALDFGFDASGEFRIRPVPKLEPKASVWTFRTGEASNINGADRERPLDRMYNTVVMQPMEESQSWDQIVIVLGDVDHPLHPSKYGDAQFFYKSPTLETRELALAAGQAIMERFLGKTETINLDALSNPALEVGDVITIAHEATDTDPGFVAIHMIDSFQMDLKSGDMSLATRSASLADLEES